VQLIAIAGQLAYGKDMLADHLKYRLNLSGQNWTRSAFANAVKQVFELGFDVDRDFIERWKRNPDPPEGFKKNIRQSLQFIGDGFRQIKDNIWIEIALRNDNIILSDSRYINEAKAVRERNGICIVMYRPGFENDDPNPSEAQIKPIVEFCKNYLEEGPIPDFEQLKEEYGDRCPDEIQYYDFYISNDGTLDELYDKTDRILIPFIEKRYSISEKQRCLF
jgi:hypothetical protein